MTLTEALQHPRCLGTDAAECQSCARRIEREDATPWTWWMVPPIARPCAMRVELEVTDEPQ